MNALAGSPILKVNAMSAILEERIGRLTADLIRVAVSWTNKFKPLEKATQIIVAGTHRHVLHSSPVEILGMAAPHLKGLPRTAPVLRRWPALNVADAHELLGLVKAGNTNGITTRLDSLGRIRTARALDLIVPVINAHVRRLKVIDLESVRSYLAQHGVTTKQLRVYCEGGHDFREAKEFISEYIEKADKKRHLTQTRKRIMEEVRLAGVPQMIAEVETEIRHRELLNCMRNSSLSGKTAKSSRTKKCTRSESRVSPEVLRRRKRIMTAIQKCETNDMLQRYQYVQSHHPDLMTHPVKKTVLSLIDFKRVIEAHQTYVRRHSR